MIALTGPIEAIDRADTVDRRDVRGDWWVSQPAAVSAPAPWGDAADRDLAGLSAVLAGDVFVGVVGDPDDGVLERAAAAAAEGARIYLLGAEDALQRLPAGDVAARVLGAEAGSWCVRGAGGLAWGAGARLTLDAALARAAHALFTDLWWYEAAAEWRGGRRAPLEPSPFGADERADLRDAPVRLETGARDRARDARLLVAPRTLPGVRPPTVLTRPHAVDAATLAEWARAGTRVLGLEADRALPALAIAPRRCVVGLPAGARTLRIEIADAAFAAAAGHHVESLATWRLQVDQRLGDVAGPVWLPGEAPRRTVARQTRTLAPVVAPLDARFPDAQPTARPAPDPLALEVADAWRVEPPRLPAGAAQDALHREWARLDDAVQVRARQASAALAAEAPGVARALLDQLTGRQALEGQRRALNDEAKALAEVAPSERAEEAAERCRRLIALEAEVEAWRRARGAAIDEARQREAHAARVAEAQARCAALEAGRAPLDATLRAARVDLAAAEAAWSAARDGARAGAIERVAAALAEAVEAAEQALGSMGSGSSSRKKNKRRQAAQDVVAKARAAAEAGPTAADIEEAIDADPAVRSARAAHDTARRAAAGADAAWADAQRALADARAAADAPLVLRPRAEASAPAPAPLPPVPAEALPAVGALHRHEGRRLLAIRTWHQVPQARLDAARLGAELVV